MINDYRRHLLAAGRRARTIELRAYWLLRIQSECGPLALVSASQLEDFLAQDWKPETRKSIRSTVRGFYMWATKTGRVTEDPSIDLESVRIPVTVPNVAVDLDVARALRSLDTHLVAMIALARFACLRLDEITTLRTDHRHGETIRFEGKGGSHRIVYLHPEAARALDTLERDQGHGYYFPGRYGGHLHKHTIYAKIKRSTNWNPHALRHAGATAAYRSTNDLRAIQAMLGHTSIATTQKYLHLDGDAQRRAAFATSLAA